VKFYLETFGCQMNVHDSERVSWILSREGHKRTGNPTEADLILINTCSIREKAEDKVYSRVGRLALLRRSNPVLRIGLLGCMAQQHREKLFKRQLGIDFVIGPDNLSQIPEILGRLEKSGEPQIATEFCRSDENEVLEFSPDHPIKSYINIIKGCNNFCSYCVVPNVRGPEISRPESDILDETRKLVDAGYKEITLLGQNVNSYHGSNNSSDAFSGLLRLLDSAEGLERIRFTTSHPKDFSGDIIEAVAELDKVCEHIHLPIQSGSNRILAGMNRGYTREQYLEKICRLRETVSGLSITTDIIVGFPGEGDSEFERTVRLLEEVKFDSIFAFAYNRRPGTRAFDMEDSVPSAIKRERLVHVNEIQKEISEFINNSLVDREVQVLFDGYSQRDPQMMTGRTRTNKVVNVPIREKFMYTIQNIRVKSASAFALKGTIQLAS